jgi:succinoglycan biosynthesis protein ExoM
MESNCELDDEGLTVCICTYRRSHVLATIESVVSQALGPIDTRIIVIDNDITPSARGMIEAYNQAKSFGVTYIHAPAQNISIARNAGLDTATTRWLAFIDDDELASSNWIKWLYAARNGASAVFGVSTAIYPTDAPAWIKAGDYHSNRIEANKQPIITGYTSNVLVDLRFVHANGLRFDTLLGRTGGEDTMFFHAMYHKGGVLKYAPEAIVYDQVAPSRINLRWIATRRYRGGQVYAMMFHRYDLAGYRCVVWSAPFKIIACAMMLVVTAISPVRATWWLIRGAFHCGILSYALGAQVVDDRDTTKAPVIKI